MELAIVIHDHISIFSVSFSHLGLSPRGEPAVSIQQCQDSQKVERCLPNQRPPPVHSSTNGRRKYVKNSAGSKQVKVREKEPLQDFVKCGYRQGHPVAQGSELEGQPRVTSHNYPAFQLLPWAMKMSLTSALWGFRRKDERVDT